ATQAFVVTDELRCGTHGDRRGWKHGPFRTESVGKLRRLPERGRRWLARPGEQAKVVGRDGRIARVSARTGSDQVVAGITGIDAAHAAPAQVEREGRAKLRG